MKLLLAGATALSLFCATSAQAFTIDFDEFTSPPVTCCFADTGVVGSLVYPGVRLGDSASTGAVMNGSGWANMQTSGDNLYGTTYGSMFITFTVPTASNVQFDLINGTDPFTFKVVAYRGGTIELGTINPFLTGFATPGSVSHVTLNFYSYGISTIIITGSKDFAIDTLSWDGAVPEPASWAMMIGGFAIAGAAMRRKAAKVAFA